MIIGYGSTIREDDGVGIIVANELACKYLEVEVAIVHQLLPEHVEMLEDRSVVVFVDAKASDKIGEVEIVEIDESEYGADKRVSEVAYLHTLDPNSLLFLCKILKIPSPKRAYLYSISSSCFELRDRLSPKLEEKLDEIVDDFEKFILALKREVCR